MIGQLALHDFIERGELDRHVRRMRARYQRRREALVDGLARWLPQSRIGEDAAGLFQLVKLEEGVDEAALTSAAAERGVGVEGLALHRFSSGGSPGLVLGFGCLPEPAIDRGLRLLGEALAEATSA